MLCKPIGRLFEDLSLIMDRIEIGAVAKPQGIKGELKIKLFADNFHSVSKITNVEIDGKEYKVEYFKSAFSGDAIIKLVGLDDRGQAENLRMKSLFAFRNEIIVPKGRFFISDVVGCKLTLSSGKELGTITDIVNGNVDYYYIITDEGKAVFPLIKELNAVFDLENGKVIVDSKKFTEVVLYED